VTDGGGAVLALGVATVSTELPLQPIKQSIASADLFMTETID